MLFETWKLAKYWVVGKVMVCFHIEGRLVTFPQPNSYSIKS